MAKKTELLINVVIAEQAKTADRPDPKWERSRDVPLNGMGTHGSKDFRRKGRA